MYRLQDSSHTYEACRAASLRRPREIPSYARGRQCRELARRLGREAANRRAIANLVWSELGRDVPPQSLTERFEDLLCSGRLVLRRLGDDHAYPLPDPYAETGTRLSALAVEESDATQTPESWLSLEVVHSGGLSTANVPLQVVTPSGREIHGTLDGNGRWRVDRIDRGSCSVRLLDHPCLREQAGETWAQSPPEGATLWDRESKPVLSLRSANHHRILVVRAPERYSLSV